MSSRWLDKQENIIAVEDAVSVFAEDDIEAVPRRYKSGDVYIWQKGDSLVDLARDMHVEYDRLLAYNEIESYQELEDGVPIYYPSAPAKPTRNISVEVFDDPLHMHVSRPGGAKKWAFGAMETLAQAQPNGFFPEHTNVLIVACARVPLVDPDDEHAEAAYYLDYNALGKYKESGLLRFSIGFAWSDLGHGHVETMLKRAAPAADPVIPPYLLEDVSGNEDSDTQIEESTTDDIQPEVLPNGLTQDYIDGIMNSYQKLPADLACVTEIPNGYELAEIDRQTSKRFVWIHDYSKKRQDKPLYQNQAVEIGATFEVDGEVIGRPVESIDANNFFGIPMSLLQSEDDLFNNDNVDADTRAQLGGALTWSERYVWVPVNQLLQKYAPGYLKKINKHKEQK